MKNRALTAEQELQQNIASQLYRELSEIISRLDAELTRNCPDKQARIGQVFARLLEQLNQNSLESPLWNRIIQTNLPEDLDLCWAVLGRLLEKRIRADVGKNMGTYYTNPDIVRLMCRLALWHYLIRQQEIHSIDGTVLGRVIFTEEFSSGVVLTDAEKHILLELLCRVTVIDPAMGSGAFLLGMLAELTALRVVLGDVHQTVEIRKQILTNNLFGVEPEPAAVELVKCSLRLSKVQQLDHIKVGDALFLDWEQCFPEVMSTGGFDIMLANPPYIRQDKIEKNYKERLIAAFQLRQFNTERRADIYVYFYALAAQILQDKGSALIISSNAWLDVEYGANLKEFLLEQFKLKLVLDSSKERWFSEAGVNTAIAVLERYRGLTIPGKSSTRSGTSSTRSGTSSTQSTFGGRTTFINLQQGLQQLMSCRFRSSEEASWLVQIADALSGTDCDGKVSDSTESSLTSDHLMLSSKETRFAFANNQFRSITVSTSWLQKAIQQTREKHNKQDTATPVPTKWGIYLRAPEIYFRLLAAAEDKLCCLGDIAKVKRGFTTGNNEFFYLKAGQHSSVEEQYLRPVIKSPKEIEGYLVKPENLKYKVILLPPDRSKIAPGALKYLQEGESAALHKRPALIQRHPWWKLEKQEYPTLIFRRFFSEKFNLPFLSAPIAEDQTFYGIYYQGDPLLLAAVMNSTLTWLFIELQGRTGLGEGVLQYAVYEAEALHLLHPDRLTQRTQNRLKAAFQQLCTRNVLSLAEELASPERRLLDSILLTELTALSPRENIQEKLYAEFSRLVQERITKAGAKLS